MHSQDRVVFVFVEKEEKNQEQKPKLWSLVSRKRPGAIYFNFGM